MNVKLIYQEAGQLEYQLIHIQSETGSDLPIDKHVIIEGNRGDGSIVIPGGKRSLRINVRGIITGKNYEELTNKMNEMKTKITTNVATLTLKHNGIIDWSYTVKRISDVRFMEGLRTTRQEYEIVFLIISY